MLIERLLKVALLGSSWVLYLLLALSVLSFSTMFERFLFFRRHSVDFDALRKQLRKNLQDDDLVAAEKLLSGSKAIEARVALEALHWAAGGPGAMTDAVDSELARVKTELERGSNLLGTLGNNAPFVGLLGTVIGIYNALIAIGVSGQGSIEKVAGPVGEALIMTAIGLVVAVPAVLGYNVLLRRNKTVQERVSHFTHELHAYLISGVKMGLGMDKPPPSTGVKPPAAAIAR